MSSTPNQPDPLRLTVLLATNLVAKGQAKLLTIASPAHATALQGELELPTTPPLTTTTHQDLSEIATAMPR